MFSVNIVTADSEYFNQILKSRTENFIARNDRYRIFSVHMKINKILEKIDYISFEKLKYKQLRFIDGILIDSIRNYIETNSKSKIEQKLKEVIKNK